MSPIEEEIRRPRKAKPKESTVKAAAKPAQASIWTEERRKAHASKMKEVMTQPEIRERLRVANTGRVVSEETRERLRAANTGRTVSAETKEKIREALKAHYRKEEEEEEEEEAA